MRVTGSPVTTQRARLGPRGAPERQINPPQLFGRVGKRKTFTVLIARVIVKAIGRSSISDLKGGDNHGRLAISGFAVTYVLCCPG